MCAICLQQKNLICLTYQLFVFLRVEIVGITHGPLYRASHLRRTGFCTCSTWVHKKGINHDYGLQNVHRMGLFFLGILDILCPMVH